MKRLLITDSNQEVCLALAERLRGQYEIQLCQEGNEALALLRTFRPDLLVLDLELPGLDGVTLVQWAAEAGILPVTLAVLWGEQDYAVGRVISRGVTYVMRKPYNFRAMELRLADMAGRERFSTCPVPVDLRTRVTNVLIELGAPSGRRGFFALVDAILEMIRDPSQQITKSLYPKVAELHDGNADQTEKAMRQVIEAAWDNRDPEVWRRYLPEKICTGEKRPTNRIFIGALARYLAQEAQQRERFEARNAV